MLQYAPVDSAVFMLNDSKPVTTVDLAKQSYLLINLDNVQSTRFGMLEYYDALRSTDVVFLVAADKTTASVGVVCVVGGAEMRRLLLAASGLKLPNPGSVLNFFYIFRELEQRGHMRKYAAFPMPTNSLLDSETAGAALSYAAQTNTRAVFDLCVPVRPALPSGFFVPDAVKRMELLFDAVAKHPRCLLALLTAIHTHGYSTVLAFDVIRALEVVDTWQIECTRSVVLFFALMANYDCRNALGVRSVFSLNAAWLILYALMKRMCDAQLPNDMTAMQRLEPFSEQITPLSFGGPRIRMIDRWHSQCGGVDVLEDATENLLQQEDSVDSSRVMMTSSSSSSVSSDAAARTTDKDSMTRLFKIASLQTKLRTVSGLGKPPRICGDYDSAYALVQASADAVHLLRLSGRRTPQTQNKTHEYMVCAHDDLWSVLRALWAENKVDVWMVWADKYDRSSLYNTAVRPCSALYMPWTLAYVPSNAPVEEYCARNSISLLWKLSPETSTLFRKNIPGIVVCCLCWTAIKCLSPLDATECLIDLRAELPPEWKYARHSHMLQMPPTATGPRLPYVFDPTATATHLGVLSHRLRVLATVRAALHYPEEATSAVYLIKDSTLLCLPTFPPRSSKRTAPLSTLCTFGTCNVFHTNLCAMPLRADTHSKLHVGVAVRGELPLVFTNMWLHYAERHIKRWSPQWWYECNVRFAKALATVYDSDKESAPLPQYGLEQVRTENSSANTPSSATATTWNVPTEILECDFVKKKLSHLSPIEVHATVLLGRLDEQLGSEWSTWSKIGRNLFEACPGSEWLRTAFRWWSYKCDSSKYKERDHAGYSSVWEQYNRRGSRSNPTTAMKVLAASRRAVVPPAPETILKAVFSLFTPE